MRSTLALGCLLLVLAFSSLAVAKGIEDDFTSQIREVRPPVAGLDLKVVQKGRMLRLHNGSRETVLVEGYDNEPYLRFLPSQVVQVNTRSPSKYTNEDRYALRPVPAIADSGAKPKWQTIASNGTYEWFEHRIHWMERTRPSEVKDPDKRTKVFDWNVPLRVGARRASVLGTLFWDPGSSSSGFPTGLAIALGVLALAILAVTLILLRRRRPHGERVQAEKEVKEAW